MRQGRTGVVVLILGLLCLLAGSWLLLQVVNEKRLQDIAKRDYQVEDLLETKVHETRFSRTPLWYEWRGNRVTFLDPYEHGAYTESDTRVSPVRVLINGKDFSVMSPVLIRPADHDDNRYFSQLMLVLFKDVRTGVESLVVVQCVPSFELSHPARDDFSKLICRVLWISQNGQVRAEVFKFNQRHSVLYRTLLANEVSPYPLGYYSDAVVNWAMLGVPVYFVSLVIIAISVVICTLEVRPKSRFLGGGLFSSRY